MDSHDKHLKTITRWAASEERLRAMLMINPSIPPRQSDRLSSINLSLFVTDLVWFSETDNWLSQFGPFWLEIHFDQKLTQEHTVIYEDGGRMNFSLHANATLSNYETLDSFKVLIDKDRQAKQLPQSKGRVLTPSLPTPKAFLTALDTFWLEAYQAVKFLWRGELWRSKHYDWQMKQHLLEMLAWQAMVCQKQSNFTMEEGQGLSNWVDSETYTSLMSTFGRLYPADSWRALEETVKLFTHLAKQVAADLEIAYPEQKEQQFTVLVKDLLANPTK